MKSKITAQNLAIKKIFDRSGAKAAIKNREIDIAKDKVANAKKELQNLKKK